MNNIPILKALLVEVIQFPAARNLCEQYLPTTVVKIFSCKRELNLTERFLIKNEVHCSKGPDTLAHALLLGMFSATL